MTELYIPPYFQAQAAMYPELRLYRVAVQERGLYRLIDDGGELTAELSGRFMYRAAAPSDYPVVGDYVMAEPAEGGGALIHELLHRKSVFLRRAAGTVHQEQAVAANVDTLFICMSMNHNFNLRRLERYLSAGWDSGAAPVVLLTKSDLAQDAEGMRQAAQSVAMGAEILVCSSLSEDGLEALLPYAQRGKTLAFVGSSGVGKSTLINRLLGEERLETRGVRDDDRGRHTTTHRELIILPGGAVVIDTPGMRELGMWEAEQGLDTAFADIRELTGRCRFKNCSHQNEPGCAVTAALEAGQLSPERWQSYRKLSAESAYAGDAEGYLAAKKKKFKDIAKYNKGNIKK